MMPYRRFNCVVACAIFVSIVAQPRTRFVEAQEAGKAKAEAEFIVRVYPVADLVFSAPSYPFQGIDAAAGRAGVGTTGSTKGFGGGGFGGAGHGGSVSFGGGGFGGGGMFSFQDNAGSAEQPGAVAGVPALSIVPTQGASGTATAVTITMNELIHAITNSIEPESWSEVGGPGTIDSLGSKLVIRQVESVHTQIEQLLDALRSEGGQGTVTVRAYWLSLSDEQYESLIDNSPLSSPRLVDRAELKRLAEAASAECGEVTCFDGQTVHIISGRFRNAVTSIIPVVGQIESDNPVELANPANFEGVNRLLASRDKDLAKAIVAVDAIELAMNDQATSVQSSPVGYQPLVAVQHSGVVLELTPIRLPEVAAIVLDLRSVMTRWSEQPQESIDFKGVVQLDRTSVVSQQLATTLKVPVGKPVLAGGLTLEPGAAKADGEATRLYLVVEATDEESAE